jgi:meso-butanediol dehydrogenase/(S,S)-butanediol dehydrogenase/diacetyl reductase
MAERFVGKVVFITGAARGIGADIARHFLREGARVVVADVNAGAAQARALKLGPDNALALACDVCDEASVKAAVAQAEQVFGGIDILVNNAAVFDGLGMQAPDLPLEAWDRSLRTIATGTFLMCKAAIPALRRRGGGAIVNISSTSGLRAEPGYAAYNAAKAAVLNFTRALALDHGRDNIRVNAVCPGPILSSPQIMFTRPEVEAVLLPAIPMGRYGRTDDIARAVPFLASDDAPWITGVALPVDGGITASFGVPDLYEFVRARPV